MAGPADARGLGTTGSAGTVTGDVFVGRAWERRELAAAITGAVAGRGGLVLISGEAGIGKTRLARKAIADGASTCTVVWAGCWDGDDAPPYWPWMQVVRELQTDVGRESTRLDRRALSVLDPAVSDAPPWDAHRDPVAARARLFDAVFGLLSAAAATKPVVLVVDDLHWADEPSMLLLRHVGAHLPSLPVAIIGTYRDAEVALDPRRSSLFAELARAARVVPLGGLDDVEVGDLVAASVDRDVPSDWVTSLARRTAGNPFFAKEVLRLLSAQGRGPGDSLVAVPPSVVEVVVQRVARLPQAVSEILEIAASIGERFGVHELVAGGYEVEAAIGALDVAGAAGLVRSGSDGFAFTHGLVRDALYEHLGPGRRARLHQQLGCALERAGSSPEVLAHHFGKAAALGETARAARYAADAGEAALGRLAHEDALEWFEQAAHFAGPDDEGTQLRALLGRAEVHRRAGDATAARADLDEVAAAARRRGDAATLARAALGVQRLGFRSGQLHEAPIELLEDAAGLLGQADVELRAVVLSALANELWDHAWDRAEEARARSGEVLELAERAGSPSVVARCLEARYTVEWAPGAAAHRAAVAHRMAELARTSGDAEQHATALLLEATALHERGDPRAVAVASRFFEVGSGLGLPRMDYQVLTRRAAVAMLQGDLDRAALWIDQSAELAARLGEPDAVLIEAHQRAELLRFPGRRGELLDAAPPPVLTVTAVSLFGRVERPLMLLDAGRVDEARALFDDAARTPLASVKRDWIFLHNVADLAEAARRLGDRDVAARCYEALLPYAGTACIAAAMVCFSGSVDHHLGALALTLGNHAAAVGHLEAAAEMHDRLGGRLWALASRELLAQARAASATVTPRRATMRRDGRVWRLSFGEVDAYVADAKGMRDLAVLIERVGEEIHATQLYGGPAGAPSEYRGDAAVDADARAAYRQRLAAVEAELAEAEDRYDLAWAERLSVEREALIDELRRNFDLKGRPRRLGDMSERARKAVSARIRDAIAAIEAAHPELGSHLRTSVRTGTFCSYQPPERTSREVRQI